MGIHHKPKGHNMTIDDAQLLTEEKVAGLLCVTVRTLRQWRYERRGPVHYKMGRGVRYRISDIIKWQRYVLSEVAPSA